VQVEVGADGKLKIARVDTAVDAGTIVNPEMARQQFEGAATFGASLALYGEITAKNGAIQQSNFDGYPMARMSTAPRETHVYLVESDAPPAGIGEPGVPPFTPALCTPFLPRPENATASCHFRKRDWRRNRTAGMRRCRPGGWRSAAWTRANELFKRKFVFLCAFLCAGTSVHGQRRPVLPQIDLPHPYYYRELYLPH